MQSEEVTSGAMFIHRAQIDQFDENAACGSTRY